MKKLITIAFASAITLAAMAMAAASAWQRAEASLDRALLIGVACVIVAAVHLLPALLSRRSVWLVWPIWSLCFLAATYGHLWFFTSAGQSAAEARAAMSAHARSVQERRQAIEQALSSIRARPVATVAQLHARATTPERQQALAVELEEAQRAARLRDELVSLFAIAPVTAVTDPVTARVTAITGWTAEAVSLGVNVFMAVLLELLGMLIWLEVLRAQKTSISDAPAAPIDVQIVPAELSAELDRLRLAIEAGECVAKVSEIRQFLNCSQARAMQLRRDLLAGAERA